MSCQGVATATKQQQMLLLRHRTQTITLLITNRIATKYRFTLA